MRVGVSDMSQTAGRCGLHEGSTTNVVSKGRWLEDRWMAARWCSLLALGGRSRSRRPTTTVGTRGGGSSSGGISSSSRRRRRQQPAQPRSYWPALLSPATAIGQRRGAHAQCFPVGFFICFILLVALQHEPQALGRTCPTNAQTKAMLLAQWTWLPRLQPRGAGSAVRSSLVVMRSAGKAAQQTQWLRGQHQPPGLKGERSSHAKSSGYQSQIALSRKAPSQNCPPVPDPESPAMQTVVCPQPKCWPPTVAYVPMVKTPCRHLSPPVSKPKIHYLESLLNHNVQPVHV